MNNSQKNQKEAQEIRKKTIALLIDEGITGIKALNLLDKVAQEIDIKAEINPKELVFNPVKIKTDVLIGTDTNNLVIFFPTKNVAFYIVYPPATETAGQDKE